MRLLLSSSQVSRVFLPLIFVSLYFCSYAIFFFFCLIFEATNFGLYSNHPFQQLICWASEFKNYDVFHPRKSFLCCNWISLSAVVIFLFELPSVSSGSSISSVASPLECFERSSLWLLVPSLRIFPLCIRCSLKPAVGYPQVRSPESRDGILTYLLDLRGGLPVSLGHQKELSFPNSGLEKS